MARIKYYNPTTQQWEYADSNPLPTGETDDILVNENGVWVAKPKWQMIYQPVEWIEGTGTQYIDTGVVATNRTRIVTENMLTQITEFALEGTTYHSGLTLSFGKILNKNTFNYRYGKSESSSSWVDTGIPVDTSTYHTWDIGPSSQKLDGVEYGTISFDEVSSNNSILLFTRNQVGVATPSKMRKTFAKVYEGEEAIRDYIPVRNVFTGEIGMYDKVNNQFCGNAGTGTFLKGADV